MMSAIRTRTTTVLTRSLFTFAALAVFAGSAIAQDIPDTLVPPQQDLLVGKYAAKGVQVYVCDVKGAVNEWDFRAPEAELIDARGGPFARHYAGPTWEATDGSKVVGKVFGKRGRSEGGCNSLAAIVDKILRIGGICRRALRPTNQHLRRSRADRRVSDGRNGAACRLHG
jgi:hypothetical protein